MDQSSFKNIDEINLCIGSRYWLFRCVSNEKSTRARDYTIAIDTRAAYNNNCRALSSGHNLYKDVVVWRMAYKTVIRIKRNGGAANSNTRCLLIRAYSARPAPHTKRYNACAPRIVPIIIGRTRRRWRRLYLCNNRFSEIPRGWWFCVRYPARSGLASKSNRIGLTRTHTHTHTTIKHHRQRPLYNTLYTYYVA